MLRIKHYPDFLTSMTTFIPYRIQTLKISFKISFMNVLYHLLPLLAFVFSPVSQVTIYMFIYMAVCWSSDPDARKSVLRSIAKINSLHFPSSIRDERMREKDLVVNAF